MAQRHLQSAIEQAEALQDRLVKAAYGLHFSCENIAALMEQRGHLHRVSATDFPTEAKRWRAAGSQALDLVRVWGRGQVPEVVAGRGREALEVARQRAAGELADVVIGSLDVASLRLDWVISEGDQRAAARLREVAELLDTAIREVHQVITDLTEQPVTAAPDWPDEPTL